MASYDESVRQTKEIYNLTLTKTQLIQRTNGKEYYIDITVGKSSAKMSRKMIKEASFGLHLRWNETLFW